jgi:hypothetical protein
MEAYKKVISPVALNALSEALTHIYWYKPELRNFLTNTLPGASFLTTLNWQDYKRNIASALISQLARNQDLHKDELLTLMIEVCKIDDYSHLEKLEDGKKKAAQAKQAVEALRKQVKGHSDLMEEHKKQEERRKRNQDNTVKVIGVQQKLAEINKDFTELVGSNNPQIRGFKLEKIFKELFALFDLDPKASFKIKGEQIDGAFTFENNDFLFEGKWQQELCGIQDLDAFNGKLTRKLDNTLGLFCSINGFSPDALSSHSTGRRMMILMDGQDLMAVLEGRIDLVQLLLRKRRHASQTGNIYLRIQDILLNN